MSTATNDKLRLVNGTTANGHWTITEANEHYDIGRWGQGYFSVSPDYRELMVSHVASIGKGRGL